MLSVWARLTTSNANVFFFFFLLRSVRHPATRSMGRCGERMLLFAANVQSDPSTIATADWVADISTTPVHQQHTQLRPVNDGVRRSRRCSVDVSLCVQARVHPAHGSTDDTVHRHHQPDYFPDVCSIKHAHTTTYNVGSDGPADQHSDAVSHLSYLQHLQPRL